MVAKPSNPEIRPFSYISGIFKHIESYHLRGHQIGRKVGDMLELIVMGKIFSDENLKSRLVVEPKVLGVTGAGHKVEFAFYENEHAQAEDMPFGIVECKKVGVEVTKSNTTRINSTKLKTREKLELSFRPDWTSGPTSFELLVNKTKSDSVSITLSIDGKKVGSGDVKPEETLKIAIDEEENPFYLLPSKSLRDIDGIIRLCKIVKLEQATATESKWGVFDCLTGPQTIEKAKQAALVAMDVRKKVDGQWGKDDLSENEKHVTSILVLTEASHWEEKSRKVITTCIDHNIIVPDDIIVTAFKEFEKKFGFDEMLPLIAKNTYLENEAVRKVIDQIVSANVSKLFYDLDLGSYVDIAYKDGRLIISSVS